MGDIVSIDIPAESSTEALRCGDRPAPIGSARVRAEVTSGYLKRYAEKVTSATLRCIQGLNPARTVRGEEAHESVKAEPQWAEMAVRLMLATALAAAIGYDREVRAKLPAFDACTDCARRGGLHALSMYVR
jgi:hypothetical protein